MAQFINRRNNFDFLRLFFSTLVIYSHSYPLSSNRKDLLEVLTNDQTSFGFLSVNVFFAMSGYLILNSLKYSMTPYSYLWKRVLRLFPGLFCMLIFTLIVVLFINQSPNIFSQKDFYTYLPNNMTLYRVQQTISGVFDKNVYPQVMNGSLWTLRYEFTMYLYVLLLFPIRKKNKILLTILLVFFVLTYYAIIFNSSFLSIYFGKIRLSSIEFYRLSNSFVAGCVLSMFKIEKINNIYTRLGLFIMVLLAFYFRVYSSLQYLILPLLTLLIAISYSKVLEYIPKRIGDISYGVYIYAFFIQQTLMHFYTFNVYSLMACSLAITYVLSYLSWHFVEKKFLRYKDLVK